MPNKNRLTQAEKLQQRRKELKTNADNIDV